MKKKVEPTKQALITSTIVLSLVGLGIFLIGIATRAEPIIHIVGFYFLLVGLFMFPMHSDKPWVRKSTRILFFFPFYLMKHMVHFILAMFEYAVYLFIVAGLTAIVGGIVFQEVIAIIAGILLSIGITLYKKHVIFGSDKSAVIGTLVLIALVGLGIGLGTLLGAW